MMDSEDWKAFKKKGQEIRRGRQERHRKAILRFALNNGMAHQYIQEWQIRISDGNTTMDLFPQSKRYHNLTTNKRGDYYNLHGFLKSVFKKNEAGGRSAKDTR